MYSPVILINIEKQYRTTAAIPGTSRVTSAQAGAQQSDQIHIKQKYSTAPREAGVQPSDRQFIMEKQYRTAAAIPGTSRVTSAQAGAQPSDKIYIEHKYSTAQS